MFYKLIFKKFKIIIYAIIFSILVGIVFFLPVLILKSLLGLSFLLIFLFYHYLRLNINKRLNQPVLISTEERKYHKDIEMAKRVQEALLTVDNPQITGIKLAKKCIPAESVGGDFYTFSYSDFQSFLQKSKFPGVIEYQDQKEAYLNIIIGDVAGHGLSSALVMALCSGLLRELSINHRSPGETLTKANQALYRYISNSQISYVTTFFASINSKSKKMIYAKGGHPSALLFNKEGNLTVLDSTGVFLGMFKNESYEEKELQLNSNDRLFFYTDGITEMQNEENEFFGLERFIEIIRDNLNKPIDDLIELIFVKLHDFSGDKPLKDDQSLVIAEIE
ncbi:MAG: PP2C family protein-serine/threonine phosphatase [Candidatus Margulisiibacteriota bacterium]|jgi:serine phosphatase RsbU (regulator of sigma subunit)